MSKTILTIAAAAAALVAGSALASTPTAKPSVGKTSTPQQVAANALPPASSVAPSGQPAPAAAGTKSTYAVNGFRSATFGMSEDEVKAAINRDFGIGADKIVAQASPLEGTTALAVRTALPPGPGEATIDYIFGAKSRRLTHVNVVWATGPTPTDAERGGIATAGLQLSKYFQGQSWQRFVQPAASQNGVLMFGGLDPKGAAVLVETDGIKLSVKGKDGKVAANDPKGPAILHVSYDQDVAHPDIVQIKQGSF